MLQERILAALRWNSAAKPRAGSLPAQGAAGHFKNCRLFVNSEVWTLVFFERQLGQNAQLSGMRISQLPGSRFIEARRFER